MTAATPAETAEDAPQRHRSTFHPLRVSSVEPLTADAVAITFEVPDELADEYAFAPGQHLTLRRFVDGEEVRRNYSICAPAGERLLRVAVKRLAGGAFSTFATGGLGVGDVIDVLPASGRFTTTIDPSTATHRAFLAAGSGITPVLSLLATTLRDEPSSVATLVYGNRSTADVMFLEELADLKDTYPGRLSLFVVLSREATEVDLLHGRIDAAKIGALLDSVLPADTVDEWFLCGPFAMVEQARATLLDRGVDRRSVHLELFHVDGSAPRPAGERPDHGAPPPSGASVASVRLDGRTTEVEVHPGEVVLDAALRVRSDAPFACRGGVCGTCRARLVDGEVAMRTNWALEPDEIEAGYVLACQSEPRSPRVSLDFDG